MLFNYNENLKEMQLRFLDDDTFNFLVELRSVSLGSYCSLIKIMKDDTRMGVDFMKECQRYWDKWLKQFKPNVFQIAYCARKGYLD